MIKYNEAQSVRKTYEHIVKRLQEERLSFDNQLGHFERSLKSKKQDAKELEMMSKDANHAKECAKAELSRIETHNIDERKQRDKSLQTKKEVVKQRLQELQEKLDRKVTTVVLTYAPFGFLILLLGPQVGRAYRTQAHQ